MSAAIRSVLLLAKSQTPSEGLLLKAANELDEVLRARAIVAQDFAAPGSLSDSQREFLQQWCGLEDDDAATQD